MFSEHINEAVLKVRTVLCDSALERVPFVIDKINESHLLDFGDFATLLKARNSRYHSEILNLASKVTRKNFDGRVGFIVPIYIDTRCNNKCRYCGMASYVKDIERKWLDYDSFLEELEIVVEMGYNTVELVAGSWDYDLCLIKKMMGAIRSKVKGSAFCFDSLSEEQYAAFVDSQDTMIHFQETYDSQLYEYYHPQDTPKGDFEYRLNAPERAISAGLTKPGLGILFGLGNIDYDVLMLIEHGKYLQKECNISPKVIGIARHKKAEGTESQSTPFLASDNDHLFATAIYRLAFPNAEIVASTRETLEHIQKLLTYSATFTNFCCSLEPGGYKELREGLLTDGQFHYYSPGYEKMKTVISNACLNMDFNRCI